MPTLEYAEMYIASNGQFWFVESYREFSVLTPFDEEIGVTFTTMGHLQKRHIEDLIEHFDYSE